MDEIEPLISAIIQTIDPEDTVWEEFSLVIDVKENGSSWGNFGYAFNGNEEPDAITANTFEFTGPLKAYLIARGASQPYPVRVLVQFNRDSGKYNVELEDTDTTRWQVTPGNLDRLREELRPNLG